MRTFTFTLLLLCILCIAQCASAMPYGSLGERLNRLLEKRQQHEHEASKSYRRLLDHGYNVYPTTIIAGHLRQVRRLSARSPNDHLLQDFYFKEKARMDIFVEDVEELNRLTDNRLYYALGSVKDSTFDDLISFLYGEIRRCRRR